MRKRFKSRKKTLLYSRMIMFLIVIITSFFIAFNYLSKRAKIKVNGKDVFNYFVSQNGNFLHLNNSDFVLDYALGSNIKSENKVLEQESPGEFMEDPQPNIIISEPEVYLYNTHQTETYNKDVITAYNISPTVMLSSYMLREQLNNLGIQTVVETSNIKTILNEHDWIYKDSYKASRLWLENAKKEYPSLKIFVDLHRDSSVYKNTTINENNKSYARIMFVVGLDHQNYAANLINTEKLNDIIKNTFPNLSRGIYKKSGKGVNGIYNQDFNENTFLIEIGGQYNSIDEVKNTIPYVAKAISEYLKDDTYEKET